MRKTTSFSPKCTSKTDATPGILTQYTSEEIIRISALAPFLAEHFDIVMIDPRFYPDRISKAIEYERVDSVLIVENMGSFTENEIKFIY